jgi:hypothetical protein
MRKPIHRYDLLITGKYRGLAVSDTFRNSVTRSRISEVLCVVLNLFHRMVKGRKENTYVDNFQFLDQKKYCD